MKDKQSKTKLEYGSAHLTPSRKFLCMYEKCKFTDVIETFRTVFGYP